MAMKVICAWCGQWMGLKPSEYQLRNTRAGISFDLPHLQEEGAG